MLLHPLIYKDLADQHIEELREEARRARLARASRSKARQARRVIRTKPAPARATS